MEKLYIWFNPKDHSFYQKWCKSLFLEEGFTNQYGHILVCILEKNKNYLRRGVSLSSYVKSIRHKEYNPYYKFLNRKSNAVDKIFYGYFG